MILITGATGTIGSAVLRRLSSAGVSTRALSRDPSQGETLPHVEWVQADLSAPTTLPPVFAGVDRLFLLTGNTQSMTRLQKNAIDAAAEAGIRHVVKLSARGADPGSKSAIARWHHEVEQHLKAAGPAWTMLRPHVFMQNLLEQAERIRTQKELRAPSGDGRIPFIDTRDIADVAATVLMEDGHAGDTYRLTGGAALDHDQVADIIGAATGQDLRYVAESMSDARTRMEADGLPDWLIESKLALASYHRAGGSTAQITRDVFDVTGHPPRTMVEFAHDYSGIFADPDSTRTETTLTMNDSDAARARA